MPKKFHTIISLLMAGLIFQPSLSLAEEGKLYFHRPNPEETALIEKIFRSNRNDQDIMKDYRLSFKNDFLVAKAYLDDKSEPELLTVNMNSTWCGGVSWCLDIWKHKRSGWVRRGGDDFVENENFYIQLLDKKDFGWHEYINPFDNHIRFFNKSLQEYDCTTCAEQG